MEITIKFGSLMSVKAEGENQKDAIAELGVFGELTPKCGSCGSDAILPVCRATADGHRYFELKCTECGHTLKLGQKKDNVGLFPKDNGAWTPPFQGRPRDDDFEDDGPPAAGVTSRPYRAPAPVDHKDEDDDLPF